MAAPQTGWEADGTYTDNAAETAFLEQIAADTDATLTVAGYSEQGRVMHRLDLGNPSGPTWLIMSAVHASELGAHEAVLAYVRDLAYSEDQDVLDYLAANRVVLLTPVNPDGLATDPPRKDKPGGLDINRDHLALVSPEARVVHDVINAVQPTLVLDAHEHARVAKVTDMEYFPASTTAVQEPIRDVSDDACQAVAAAMDANGFTHRYYHGPGRVSGREAAALHHTASVLLETWMGDPMQDRIDYYMPALEALRVWHGSHTAELAAAITQAKANAVGNLPQPYVMQRGDTQVSGSWETFDLPSGITGYDLPAPIDTAPNTNLVVNSSFEQDSPSGYNSNVTVTRTDTRARWGDYSAACTNPAGGYNRLGIRESMTLDAGTYTVRVWVWWPSSNTATPIQARFQFATGTVVNTALTGTDEWVELTATITVASETTGYLYAAVETTSLDSSDVAWFDGFGIYPGEEAPEYTEGPSVGAPHVQAYGIVTDGTHIPMAQLARGVIPLLFDEDSENTIILGERTFDDPGPDPDPPVSPLSAYVQVGGQKHGVLEAYACHRGVTYRLASVAFQPPT